MNKLMSHAFMKNYKCGREVFTAAILGVIIFAVILWLIAEPLVAFKTSMRTSSRACDKLFFASFMPAMIRINRIITGRQDDIGAQVNQPQAVPREMMQPAYNSKENRLKNNDLI